MSVLQDMTKGILETKATKASKLTPVQGETSTTVAAMAAALLPNDVGIFMSNETLASHADDLRKFAANLIAVADGLDAMVRGEKPAGPVADREAEGGPEYARILSTPGGKVKDAEAAKTKWLEAQADAKHAATEEPFDERMVRLSKEAQSAVFASLDDGAAVEPAPAPVSSEGWQCPDHGRTAIQHTKSRKGREYDMCMAPDCDHFER